MIFRRSWVVRHEQRRCEIPWIPIRIDSPLWLLRSSSSVLVVSHDENRRLCGIWAMIHFRKYSEPHRYLYVCTCVRVRVCECSLLECLYHYTLPTAMVLQRGSYQSICDRLRETPPYEIFCENLATIELTVCAVHPRYEHKAVATYGVSV